MMNRRIILEAVFGSLFGYNVFWPFVNDIRTNWKQASIDDFHNSILILEEMKHPTVKEYEFAEKSFNVLVRKGLYTEADRMKYENIITQNKID